MTVELPPVDVHRRWAGLRSAMDDQDVGAILIHNPTNIRYLTGFTGSAGDLAVTADDAVLLTDSRYAIQAPQQLEGVAAPCRVDADAPGRAEAVESLFADLDRIALEADTATWAQYRSLGDQLGADRLVATGSVVENLRAIKDPAEVARMTRAAEIATEALAAVVTQGFAGRTEREVGMALDDFIRRAGASGPAYETIVAAGPNAALPHARPSARTIEQGDLVIIDVGAVVDGYRSDMTRSFSIGRPEGDAARMLEVVTEAQAAATAMVAAGAEIADVDRTARAVIDEAGWAELFAHGTGHGVGLDIHEAPSVSGRATDTLQPGHCITVEPGVYRAGFGGVRVEDLLVVTETGATPLTTAPKEPVVA
ncbi:MAG: M24 family metallopeptidase [Acidimicrobiales bacterium]